MKFIFFALVFLAPSMVFSDCYNAGEFKGQSARASDSYKLSDDGISGVKFTISIDGVKSYVSPSDMSCRQAGEYSLVCTDVTDGKSVIEAWSIDQASSIALYTKSTSGYGSYDGITAFVGKLYGACK